MQFRKLAFLSLAFSVLIAVSISSCKKGDTGPAGTPGTPGAPGAPGNANVQTDTFTLTNAKWLYNSQYTFTTGTGAFTSWFTRYCDVTFSKLTQGMLDSGMVMVYFRPSALNAQQWVPLPYSFESGGTNQFFYNIAFETFAGKVRLHYFYTPNGSTGTLPSNLSTVVIPDYKFKIVAVAGTVSTDMKAHQVDMKDYNSVSHYLGW